MKTPAIFVLVCFMIVTGTTLIYRKLRPDRVAFRKAEKYFTEEAYSEATVHYRCAIEKGLTESTVFHRCIQAQLLGANYADAERTASEYLRLSDWNPNDAYEISELFVAGGRFDQALRILERIVKEEPGNRRARFRLGQVLTWTHDFDTAISHYRALQAVDRACDGEDKGAEEEHGKLPDWKVRLELARTLSYAGKLDDSIEQYGKLLEQRPGPGEVQAEMATVMFWKGKQEESLNILEKTPDKALTAEARLARADIHASRGEYAGAEKLYRKRLNTHPDDDKARLRLAEALSWAGKYSESLREYEAILSGRPGDIQVRRKYALVLSWMGKHEEAAAEFEKTISEESSE